MAILAPRMVPGVEFRVEVGGSNLDDPSNYLWDDPGSLWDTATWGGGEITWLDATGRVLAMQSNRGRDTFLDRVRAASLAVTLANDDGVLNPDVGGNPLNLRPGQWVRLSGRVKGDQDWEPLAVGFINNLGDLYQDAAHSVDHQWRGIGILGILGAINEPALPAPVGVGERTDERARRIFELAGYSPENVITDVGVHTMQGTTISRTYLEEAMRAGEAEGGAVYIDRTGAARFRNQTWLEDGPNEGTVQYHAGAGLGIEVIDAGTDWSLDRVINDAQTARVGGVSQRVQNTASVAQYRRRSWRRFDYECETDAQAYTLAERIVAARAWDRLRLTRLDLVAKTAEGARLLMQTDIGWRIRVTITTKGGAPGTAWAYTQDLWVQRVRHNVTASEWRVTLDVENTATGNPFDGGPYEPLAHSTAYKRDESQLP